MILGTHKEWDDSNLSEVLSNGRNMASMVSAFSCLFSPVEDMRNHQSLMIWIWIYAWVVGWMEDNMLTNLECTVLHPHCVRGAFVSHFQLDAQAVHSVALNRKGYSGYICCMPIGLSGGYGVETSASMLSARALHMCSIGDRWWAHCLPRASGIKIKMPWSASSHAHVTFTI